MTDWSEYQDDISDAISDSMDMDWSANDGARAVVRWLNENKPLSAAPQPAAPSSLAGGEGREKVARIVDPETFALIAHYTGIERFDRLSPAERESAVFKAYPDLKAARDEAFADADAILAALSPEAPSRERVRVGRLSEALIKMIEHFERVDAPEADKAVIEYASKAWAGVDDATGEDGSLRGAEWFGVTGATDETEALAVALFDARCPGVRMTDEDLHYYRAAAQRAMQAVTDELDTPALATREQAPAEAGENWPTLADLHTIKGWLYGLSTAPDLTDVVADGGVSVGDCYQQEAREFAGRIERIIAALRAQPPSREEVGCAELEVGRAVYERIEKLIDATTGPEAKELDYLSYLVASVEEVGGYDGPQAREDAQPVADAVEPIELAIAAMKGHISAIQVAKRGGGSSSLITDCINSLPEIVRWVEGGLFNVEAAFEQYEATPPAPEAEKLRTAVEALETIEQIRSEMVMVPIDSEAANAWANALERAADMAAQALAALQAEQKGGA